MSHIEIVNVNGDSKGLFPRSSVVITEVSGEVNTFVYVNGSINFYTAEPYEELKARVQGTEAASDN